MKNRDVFITNSAEKTRRLGELLGKELRGGEIICLTGELGSGKTTFAQGVLKGLGAKGPFTSPTFAVMKHYLIKNRKPGIKNIYHIDCYRVKARDILDLGWKEIINNTSDVVIVEWAEKIKSIVPKSAVWLRFKHKEERKREIIVQ